MTLKKVLFIQDHLYGGGAEQITIDIANLFISQGYEVAFCLLDGEQIKMEVPEALQIYDFRVPKSFMTGKLWRKKHKTLSADKVCEIQTYIRSFNPDIIFAGHEKSYWLSPILEGNVWFWVHGRIIDTDHKKTSNLFRWWKEKRRVYLEKKYVSHLFKNKNIIAVNSAVANGLKVLSPNSRTAVIPNGIDTSRLKANITQPLKKQWDVVFVGRLSPEKQPQEAIQAFVDSGVKGKMAVVGDGAMLNDLQVLVEELGVAERVDFLGWQKQPAEYIQSSKVLVLSSQTEGSPLVIAEALMLDTPVISYNCSAGVEHQLSSGELHRGLVELGNTEALSKRIGEVVRLPYTISSADKARLDIHTMFDKFVALLPENTSH